eukprot:scaffold133807_cov69-Phaeocystis_antarctica.AAC.1
MLMCLQRTAARQTLGSDLAAPCVLAHLHPAIDRLSVALAHRAELHAAVWRDAVLGAHKLDDDGRRRALFRPVGADAPRRVQRAAVQEGHRRDARPRPRPVAQQLGHRRVLRVRVRLEAAQRGVDRVQRAAALPALSAAHPAAAAAAAAAAVAAVAERGRFRLTVEGEREISAHLQRDDEAALGPPIAHTPRPLGTAALKEEQRLMLPVEYIRRSALQRLGEQRARLARAGRVAEVARAAHPRVGPLPLGGERGGGLVELGRPHPRALLRAPGRVGQLLRRVAAKVVPLVERPLADAPHHGDAVERILDTEGVVVDVWVLGGDVLVPG